MTATLDRAKTGGGGRAGSVPALARSSLALAAALAAAALAIWGVVRARHAGDLETEVLRACLVVVWAAAGLVLTLRRPGERMGRLVLWAAGLAGVGSLAASALRVRAHGVALSAPAVDLASLARALVVATLSVVGLHILLGAPDGSLDRWARPVVAVSYVVAGALGLALWGQRPGLPLWPVAVEVVLVGSLGLIGFKARYRRADALGRQRMRWLGWALAVGAEVVVVAVALRLLVGWPSHFAVVVVVASVPTPVALVASTSRRLTERVDRLVVHTISVAGLCGVVIGLYLFIVVGLGRVPTGNERPLLLLSMIAAGTAALLYVPARERLARFGNRLVYGAHHAPDDILRTVGSRLSRALPLDEVLLQVAESLRSTLALDAAEVWTGSDGSLERAVSTPDAPRARLPITADEELVVARAGVSGAAWVKVWLPALLSGRPDAVLQVAPVTHSGQLLGLIVAVRPPGGEPFREGDERVLTELARELGRALHNVQLDSALQASLDEVRRQAEELRSSRSRVVAAADAERRRIERNLHDGAQQHLVALAVSLGLAHQVAERDPAQTPHLLDQLSRDLQNAIQELRNLAHGIYPPLLMDRGLSEALAAAATRSAVPTTLRADGIGRYPADVEATVYFCCLEALQNAGKHADRAAHAIIRVWENAGGLLFDVTDDGAGFDPDTQQRGAGFVNMGDRLGAMGGSLRVQSAPGEGTTISGAIPLLG